MLPGIYHITVKAADALRSPFGKVVGDINKPDGDPEAPRVALSPVGQMVEQELLRSIAAHYPMVEVQDYVIMPEHMHFIVEVKRKIENRQGREAHLGQVIAGYKKGCNRRYWELTGQVIDQQGEPAGTEPVDAGCPVVLPQKKRVPSWGTTGRQPLFAYGYCDVMPVDAAQLEQQRAYIKGNPRSRLMRMSNRQWLHAQRGGIDTALTVPALRRYLQRECSANQATPEAFAQTEGRLLVTRRSGGTDTRSGGTDTRSGGTAAHNGGTAAHNGGTAAHNGGAAAHSGGSILVDCDSYGDRGLLQRRLLPVVCHRKDSTRHAEQMARCLEEAAQGTVLVSPRIAKGEQAIMDEAASRGFAVVLIADNGFPEVYHPSAERIERCAEGRLLIVTPWQYHYRRKDEGITVMECKTMNCIAQALCRQKDDWWK